MHPTITGQLAKEIQQERLARAARRRLAREAHAEPDAGGRVVVRIAAPANA